MIVLWFFVVAVIGYLLGSIPFGVFIGRAFARSDIRTVGSGKTGTTNVMRVAGKKAAALALVCDVGKGVLAVYIAGVIIGAESLTGSNDVALMAGARILAAMAAIGGHSWSVFLRFRGGRGVATFFGGMLVIYWPAALLGGGLTILIGIISRYMSLGSITASVASYIMFIVILMTSPQKTEFLIYTFYAMIGAIFIFLMHRDNVSRLVSGTERKLGEKVSPGSEPKAGEAGYALHPHRK